MRQVIITAIVLTLTGCGPRHDNTICAPIIDPPTPKDSTEAVANQSDAGWQVARADACVHRQSYRLANSSDPATVVAKAVVEACGPPISSAARSAAMDEQEVGGTVPGWTIQSRITGIEAAYERFALSKVVEGRAGRCRG